MSRKITITALLCVALIFGAGCGKKDVISPEGDVNMDVLTSMSAEEATKAIVFKTGSGFVMKQTAVSFEGKYYLETSKPSLRFVDVESFNPRIDSSVIWQLEQFVETPESVAAREAFDNEHEDGAEPPNRKYGQIISSGKLTNIELAKSHEVYQPASWKIQEDVARGTSAVWVTDDVFLELSRTRNSTVYLKAIETADELTKDSEDLQAVVAKLRDEVRDISDHVDVDFMKAEGDVVEWPIRVNDEEIKVQAIKARNWFGEIVVLNNPDNPLILKFEFNPSIEGMEAGSEEMNIIRGLLSYEITDIRL